MAGRRQVYTTEAMIDALKAERGLLSHAALRLGCARATIHNRLAVSPTLREAYAEAVEKNVDIAEGKLLEQVFDGDAKQIQFYLRTKGRARGYGDRADVDLTTGGKPIDAALLDSILARLDAETGPEE